MLWAFLALQKFLLLKPVFKKAFNKNGLEISFRFGRNNGQVFQIANGASPAKHYPFLNLFPIRNNSRKLLFNPIFKSDLPDFPG